MQTPSLVPLVAGLLAAGCMSAHTESAALSDYLRPLPRLGRPLDPGTVAVGDFAVSPTIDLPPEFQDVKLGGLADLAAESIRQELGCSPDLQMVFDPKAARAAAMRVVGTVTRVELTSDIDSSGSLWDNLTGGGSAGGNAHQVKRELILEVSFRIMRADGTAVAAGTGQSQSVIPILGSYEAEGSKQDGGAGKASTHFEGRVNKGSLSVAFRTAANDGAVRLLENIRDRQTPIVATQ
jgi:hypothetical protein